MRDREANALRRGRHHRLMGSPVKPANDAGGARRLVFRV